VYSKEFVRVSWLGHSPVQVPEIGVERRAIRAAFHVTGIESGV
jgi:hypothetical protein